MDNGTTGRRRRGLGLIGATAILLGIGAAGLTFAGVGTNAVRASAAASADATEVAQTASAIRTLSEEIARGGAFGEVMRGIRERGRYEADCRTARCAVQAVLGPDGEPLEVGTDSEGRTLVAAPETFGRPRLAAITALDGARCPTRIAGIERAEAPGDPRIVAIDEREYAQATGRPSLDPPPCP